MEAKSSNSEKAFFVAGGTLGLDAASYVTRPADDRLFELALAGMYCSVLTPRQMGKSSLMMRTARRLQEHKIRTAIVDVTDIETMINAEDWYLSFLYLLKRKLKLSIDLEDWWQEQVAPSVVTRFIYFMRDVVLTEIEGPVVIFVDEIDSTRGLDFKDDFFAAIRSMGNRRPDEPEFGRLTFVLLGVASPPELIDDEARTPFNISVDVKLQEFSWKDAAVLREGLEAAHPGQGEAIFGRIFYWTSGHPYLTQKLCLEVAESGVDHWPDARVDGLVERLFLSEEARGERNLKYLQRRILTGDMRAEMLALYRDVIKGKEVRDDGQSPVQVQLELLGLVKVESGRLRVRNEIYRRVFDRTWVRQHMSVNRAPIVAGVAVVVALLAIGLLLYNAWMGTRFNNFRDGFNQAQNAEERLVNLARTFELKPLLGTSDYAHRARDWFHGLPDGEQLTLFEAEGVDDRYLVVAVQGIYVTLADVDGTDSTGPLLEAMAEALRGVEGIQQASKLVTEIEDWQVGRQLFSEQRYPEARAAYNAAIALQGKNPATLYERARVLAEQGKYELALADLDQVVGIAREGPQATPTSLPTQTPSASRAATKGPTPTPFPIGDSEPFQGPTPTSLGKPFAETPSTAPTSTPMTTSTPEPRSILVGFVTPSQIRRAVRDLIATSSSLTAVLMKAPDSEYPNLREYSLIPDSPSLLSPRVLSIIFNPIIQSEGEQGLIEVMGWNDPDDLSQQYIADLRESSGGFVEYQIVERIEVDDWPAKVDGFRYDEDSFLQNWRSGSGWHAPDALDYEALIAEFDLLNKVSEGQIDEVWLFAFPYAGPYTSIMVGPDAFWCNAPPIVRNDVSHRFVIMGFNYERGYGPMLSFFGHRVESHLMHTWREFQGEDNLWTQFTLYDQKAPGQANCGSMNYAPNSLIDYDWGNSTPVPSNCDDWLNFPDFQGIVREMDSSDWGNGDMRSHHIWWLSHLPKAAGYTSGISNNWWWYGIDPNAVP